MPALAFTYVPERFIWVSVIGEVCCLHGKIAGKYLSTTARNPNRSDTSYRPQRCHRMFTSSIDTGISGLATGVMKRNILVDGVSTTLELARFR